ncbi:MRP-L47-domain-containing protein [Heliocybe sulcata]|uniref:Large ribosomal subunit protein uL29m n=1 Tax=Heliocybe sulcata TaxID=5364 RepID=A0A5C3N572_9AGAM|nr:MRP-L47-domain-containing protein [Heliocybe sulcata]
MLSLYRTAPGCLHVRSLVSSSSRTFASVVDTVTTTNGAPVPSTSGSSSGRRRNRGGGGAKRVNGGAEWKKIEGGPLRPQLRVQVDPNHGLYAFFRKKVDPADQSVSYDTLEADNVSGDPSGRSWSAAELRRKSFRDLHTLWYVLLRERNLLATQKEEARRLGAAQAVNVAYPAKLIAVRKSMARIKYVLNERRLAYVSAVDIQARTAEEFFAKQERDEAAEKERLDKIKREEERKAAEQVRMEARRAEREKKAEENVKAAASGIFGEEVAQEVQAAEETQDEAKDTERMEVRQAEPVEEEMPVAAKKAEKTKKVDQKKPAPPPMDPPEEKKLGDRVAAQFFGFDAEEDKDKKR